MAAGDIKLAYAASSALTQTNLDGLASSSTWVGGWESDAIDNSTNKYEDYLIAGKLKVAASGLAAGEIRIYAVGIQDDTNWPDVFDGTESAETITSAEIRNSICKLLATIATTTDADRVYPFGPVSVASKFGGILPKKFVLFITQSTTQALASTSDPNQVYVTPVYRTAATA